MTRARREFIPRVLAVALGLVFVYASHDKIWQRAGPPAADAQASAAPATSGPAAFARVIYRYQIIGPNASLPPLVANLLAVTLPWIELLAGVLLISGLWRREAALLAGVLLLVFVGAVGSALWRGIDLENCGCFNLGSQGRRAGLGLIAGDLALAAAAAVVVRLHPRPAEGPTRAEATDPAR